MNEFRSGTYALLDRNDGPDDRCALWVEVTVISDAVPEQIVVDAGSKTFTSDDHPDGGHGSILGWPGASLYRINEEHGYVDVSSLDDRPRSATTCRSSRTMRAGASTCTTGSLAVRDGVVDHVIEVAARGLVR